MSITEDYQEHSSTPEETFCLENTPRSNQQINFRGPTLFYRPDPYDTYGSRVGVGSSLQPGLTVLHNTRIQTNLCLSFITYGEGEHVIDGESGDLKFCIRAASHDQFTRERNDLHTTVTITLAEALVGFEKTIKHLDKHLVDISTTGSTKPKEVRKFEGEGMPVYQRSINGDLYVTFEVLFPTPVLTHDQKKKIKEILG